MVMERGIIGNSRQRCDHFREVPMPTLDLNNVLIGSDNPDGLAAFYTKVFGEPIFRSGGWTAWEAGNGFLTVGPHGDVTERRDAPGPVLVGFVTEDVPAEFARIKDAGATVVRPPFHPVDDPEGWLAFLADPDGNVFQIIWPTRGPGSSASADVSRGSS
jgi:predicted enzyme related to lactoylglutathione lyase